MTTRTALTRLDTAARILAALFGGYAVVYAATAFLSVYLPLARADRVIFAGLACFILYAALFIYAFAARSALRVWLVFIVLGVMFGLAAFLPSEFWVRP